MKTYKKITTVIAKCGEIVCMLMIAALVLVILTELVRRNFLNQSFRGTIELCGIAFLWMAFIGLIPLYHNSGLMRLDFLLSRTKGGTRKAFDLVNIIVSLGLGIVMVVAFIAQLPFVSTRFYSTFKLQIPYTIQYIPMAVAGAYIALEALRQLLEKLVAADGKKTEGEGEV